MDRPIKAGDVVVLKSGSQLMTVAHIEGDLATCFASETQSFGQLQAMSGVAVQPSIRRVELPVAVLARWKQKKKGG